MKKELYIGLDVHREAVAIAVAEQGRKGEVRDYGQISNDLHALKKFITRLRQTHGKRVTLRACYEAGPCGFGVARRLQQLGVECAVVAPSLTPTRAGDRLKSDKRDARNLAGSRCSRRTVTTQRRSKAILTKYNTQAMDLRRKGHGSQIHDVSLR